MTTHQWHTDTPTTSPGENRPSAAQNQFISPAGDLARHAVQRLMWADVHRRAHEHTAATWQRAGVILGAVTALAASLSAVAYVASWNWAAIALSILVALAAALTVALRCADRAAEHRRASSMLAAISAGFERYMNHKLGPSSSGRQAADFAELSVVLDSLENELRQVDWGSLPRTTPRRRDIAASAAYGEYILSGLQVGAQLPPPAAWV